MVSFDRVADEYAAARPTYPPSVYDALGDLDGRVVVEGGAGTGLATRDLRARGAAVVALDIGAQMLHHNDGARVVADCARSPVRDGVADLACFAQCWHWIDPASASAETARLLRPRGRWAGWWNHARADGEAWFDRYWDVLESMTVARRTHRDTDWGATLDRTWFGPPAKTVHPWTREVSIDGWLTDQRSHSYIGLAPGSGADVMDALARILVAEFGDGPVRCRYETWLWVAERR
jgi:SAM-dependent methyltransferase